MAEYTRSAYATDEQHDAEQEAFKRAVWHQQRQDYQKSVLARRRRK